jgi:quercetin 2,3-dioxygenase
MEKKVLTVTEKFFKENAAGFRTVDMFHEDANIEPFLVFTEFHMDRPIFGPHPHAGVSVMTYMMPDSAGSFLNRDSNGDSSIIEPGGIHVTQAGSGIKHDEVPDKVGVDCHGFQIWINHADKDRLIAPKAFHAASNEVPVYKTEGETTRVLQGTYKGITSPIELVTKTTLLDITLQPNTTLTLATSEMAFMYCMKGVVNINDTTTVSHKALVNFEQEGNAIKITTTNDTAHFLFASGTPHNEPIVYGGPFVMTTNAQMLETQQRSQRGEMGILHHL